MNSNQILLSPVVTEKSTHAQTGRKFTFLVHQDANKIQVAQAVQDAYGVKVKGVHLIKVLKKTRLAGRGRPITKRPAAKKAIVTLQGDQTIDLNKFKFSTK